MKAFLMIFTVLIVVFLFNCSVANTLVEYKVYATDNHISIRHIKDQYGGVNYVVTPICPWEYAYNAFINSRAYISVYSQVKDNIITVQVYQRGELIESITSPIDASYPNITINKVMY